LRKSPTFIQYDVFFDQFLYIAHKDQKNEDDEHGRAAMIRQENTKNVFFTLINVCRILKFFAKFLTLSLPKCL
jgi:hypothetical protein